MQVNRPLYLLIAVLAGAMSVMTACGKKEAPAPVADTRPAPPQPAATPVVETPQEKPVYVYSGDRFRDPFLPAGQSTSYQPEAVFDPQRLAVKGIIYSRSLQSAVVTLTGSGTYFIKSGKIFDIMGKTVKGFSAKVMVDRVIVMGEADTTYELKIRNNEDEEEKTL